ncbi:MAG: DNA replication and repair protein RecF [Dehalococcoidia bacterium]|nr:MAG: DNA replication and repair protein RecF [Dehalococcoidia bacterium]
MRCEHLGLTNFRNYARLELDLPPGVTVLQGDNAQGKTNFLDAIHIVATTRSARSAPEREWINWLAFEDPLPYTRIVAKVRRAASVIQIEMTATLGENGNGITKRMKINGAPRRSVDVIGQVTVVLFSPLDIDLVAGSPSQRRRYLDIMNAQVDAKYLRSLQQYNRVLLQRNSLLRLVRDRQAKPDQLAYWDLQLADLGAYVVDRRRDAVEALNTLAQDIHPALTGRQEFLHVAYRPNFGGDTPEPLPSRADLPTRLLAAIQTARAREIAQGVSLVGPHRDDLQFTTDGIDTTVYGSRGQQRTAALALKLAEAQFIRERTGDSPILLLDDVMSELDSRRRRQLLSSIRPEQQVIFTATDLEDFDPSFLARATILRVKSGRIEKAH